MLNSQLIEQLKTYLANLTKQVTLSVSVDDSDKSKELDDLATTLAGLSPLINLTYETQERTPALTISGESGSKMTFAGIPLGHEFTSLVLALLHSGGHPIKLDEEVIEQIKQLDGCFLKIHVDLSHVIASLT